MVPPSHSNDPQVSTLADNDPTLTTNTPPIVDTTETGPTNTKNTFFLRFIAKHAGKPMISLPSLLKDFLSQVINSSTDTIIFDHHDNPLNITDFPTEDDFHQRFDGGNNSITGTYYEKVFNGASTVTWIKVTTPSSFASFAATHRDWLRSSNVFLDLIKDYFGPREIVGHFFGLSVRHTNRDNLLHNINSIVNPMEVDEIPIQTNENTIDTNNTLPYCPEIKIAPFYHSSPLTPTRNANATLV